MSSLLYFGGKLNTRRTVKTVLRDYYGNSLHVKLSQFPNHFPLVPTVFLHVSPCIASFPRLWAVNKFMESSMVEQSSPLHFRLPKFMSHFAENIFLLTKYLATGQ